MDMRRCERTRVGKSYRYPLFSPLAKKWGDIAFEVKKQVDSSLPSHALQV
jgi:hypothetical protein